MITDMLCENSIAIIKYNNFKWEMESNLIVTDTFPEFNGNLGKILP